MKVEIARHKNGTSTVLFDGVDVSKNLRALHINVGLPGNPMKIIAEYACHEQAKIEGDADVIHVCPKGGRTK